MFIGQTQEELYRFFKTVAASTNLPIIMYNNKPRTNITIEPATVVRLSKIDNIVAVKDSTADMMNTIEYIRLTRGNENFSVLMGQDMLIYPSLCCGATGSISGCSNAAPRIAADIYDKYVAGDLSGSLEAQLKLTPLRIAANMGTFPQVIKEALVMEGFNVGKCLDPIAEIMFVGSFVQDRIGIKNTLAGAIWFQCIGNAICFFSKSFTLLILGRIVSGIGFGLNFVSVEPYIGTWFKGRERSFMITANLIANNVSCIIAYTIAIPLRDITGSWRGVFGVYAFIIVMVALLWHIFAKSNNELDVAVTIRSRRSEVRGESSFIRALKIKQYLLLMIIGIFLTCAITAITTFMPSYIINEKGLSSEIAITATNIKSTANVFGSLIGGMLVAKTGKRKVFLQAGLIIALVGGLLITVVQTPLLLYVTVFILGIGYMGLMPAQSTIIMETPVPFDPTILGGASALTYGFGQIVSLGVSPLFSKLAGVLGMSGAFRIFFYLLIGSIFISFMLHETRSNELRFLIQRKEI